MNEASPAVNAVLAELSRAVRRDHRRRLQRRKLMRAAAISALVLAALSTAALAAGGAFKTVETVTPVGEVELAHGVTIQAVDSFPEFVGRKTSNGFETRTGDAHWGHFIYHVTGGEAPELGCGHPGHPTNNIYITSRRPLSEQEITALLEPNGSLKPLVEPDGKTDEEAVTPPWITSESDGCPNPGIAGQPGVPNTVPVPDKASVATPTSATTRIIIRRTMTVPLASPAPSQSSPNTPQGAAATPQTGGSGAAPSSSEAAAGGTQSTGATGSAPPS
jgi:hypothetical protein